MEDLDLMPFTGSNLADNSLSEEEQLIIQAKMWKLLSRRTQLYTLCDSSSVPVETAQELMNSIRFTLQVYLEESGNSQKLLVSADLDELFNLGIKAIEEKVKAGRQLWREACIGAAEVKNISYRDTLREIGGVFFKHYDYRFMAHRIPCSIDYQLNQPVPETLLGIEYIIQYLRRVIIENDFLRHFEKRANLELLESYCPDYKKSLVNLYEPALACTVGLTLIGREILPLKLDEPGLKELSEMFEPLPESKARALLRSAAETLCRELRIYNKSACAYIERTAEDLYPRIEAVLPDGDLGGVFTRNTR